MIIYPIFAYISQGTLAYTAQQAWLQNATLKDNILFHSEYDERKYEKVLDNCCLRADIAILPGADTTEIGEKVNLAKFGVPHYVVFVLRLR